MNALSNILFLSMIIFVSNNVFANPRMPPVHFDLFSSDDCGYLTAEVPTTGADQRSLVIRFLEFGITTANQQLVNRRCELDVYVTVPKGIKFRPIAAFADGEVATSEKGLAQAKVGYSWDNDKVSNTQQFASNILDVFTVTAKPEEDWNYSACEGQDSVHYVGGDFNITAYRDENDNNDSDIALFNAEVQTKFKSRWIWQWQYCNPWLNQSYLSRYTTPNNRWVNGETTLTGNKGFYTTVNGNRGKLYNIKYYSNYKRAEGYWKFQNNQTGWFRFYLKGNEGKAFTGEWGDGSQIGVNKKGKWESR